jgi:ADP-heptose:LPS heptosyltransferase
MQILIVKTSPAKSLFHAVPTVHRLQRAYRANIDWVVHEAYTDLVACFDDVRHVISMPEDELKHANRKQFRKDLHQTTYDMVIDLEGSMQSALIAKSARKKRHAPVLGPSFQREGACLLYTAVVGRLDRSLHPVDACMDVLRYLNQPTSPIAYPVRFPYPFTQHAKKEPYWVFAIQAQRKSDRLESEFWQALVAKTSTSVILIGDRSSTPIADEIEECVDERVVNLCGRLNWAEQGGLIQASEGVVCTDERMMQLTGALGIRQVALFASGKKPAVLPYRAEFTCLAGHEVEVDRVKREWAERPSHEEAAISL